MDALYTGPVPAGLSLKELSEIRSRFWTNNKRSDEFENRNVQLLTTKEYDEVVLWFGPTSLCQLSLAQILTWFSHLGLSHPQLSLVTAYGGVLREQELRAAHAARKPVRAAQVRVATRFWNAVTSATPMRLQRLLKSDLRALPETRSTIEGLLQEYPSVQGGLSRLERKLLLEIDGIGASRSAFAVGSVNRREWIGDMLLFDMLRQFVSAQSPLLSFVEPFKERLESHEFNGAKLALTELGRKALAGKADHIALNGIDRWIGGVHLRGTRVRWRWHEAQHRIVSSRA